MSQKPRIAVHKFSSCDGCQLAFLNMGPELVKLSEAVEIIHFAEAGLVAEETPVDIAFIEGSVVTAHDQQRIVKLRSVSRYLVTIGACATSGGIQALKNLADDPQSWPASLYAQPEYIDSLPHSLSIDQCVKVDLQLWGCPINSEQVVQAVRCLLLGVQPPDNADKVCMECKRRQQVCTLVTQQSPCLGPVTRTGCGAICPRYGRDCYGCYGPAEGVNSQGMSNRLEGIGFTSRQAQQRLQLIHPVNPAWQPLTEASKDE